MEVNLLTEILLPLALAAIMLGMGLSLTPGDFKRVALYPKAVIIGLMCQLIALPLVGFGLALLWNLPPEYSVGIIILAACPGGPTSNLFAFLGNCDTALSITLTAISSVVTIFSIPLIVNLGLDVFMGEAHSFRLPLLRTMLQIALITIIPVSIGMYLKAKSPRRAQRYQKAVKTASVVFIAAVIIAVVFKDRTTVIPAFRDAGPAALSLNLLTISMGYFIASLFKLKFRQRATIAIESGIQNGTLAIAIAASATLLHQPEMAIPPAIYSLLMFFTGGGVAWIFSGKLPRIVDKEFN